MTRDRIISAVRGISGLLLLSGLLLALLLPRMSAAIGEVAGWDTFVICRGDTLVTVTVDAQGTPVELAEAESEVCPLATALAATRAPIAAWHVLSASLPDGTLRSQTRGAPVPWRGPPPERAPPIHV